jgi:hypothetical protein
MRRVAGSGIGNRPKTGFQADGCFSFEKLPPSRIPIQPQYKKNPYAIPLPASGRGSAAGFADAFEFNNGRHGWLKSMLSIKLLAK